MEIPLQITIRDIEATEFIIDDIRKKANKLAKFADNIISCHVIVDVPQKNQHNGKIYNVKVDIVIPRDEIVVNRIWNENIYIAIRDAFNASQRQLKNHVHKQHGVVKTHAPLEYGKVRAIFHEDEYGFIQSIDGKDYYFHRNNVAHPDFDQLEVGTKVAFIEAIANDGLQAHRVTVAGQYNNHKS